MIKKYLYSILLAALPLLLGSCRDDIFDLWGNGNGELPVEFDFMVEGGTRGISGPKSSFASKDVIHITGTFYFEDGSSETRYGAMQFDGKRWNALANSQLTWPNTSTGGEFEAYFISGSTGVITSGSTGTTLLSNVTPTTDPLHAETTGRLSYGHSVNLKFKHLCTYLSLLSLQPVVATQYWFVKTDKDGNADPNFKNAFTLSLDPSTNKLSFDFITVPDNNYTGLDGKPGLAYVASSSSSYNGISQTNYFLVPGYYDNFSIRYPAAQPNSTEYLKYHYTPTANPDPENENKEPDLLANTTYTLNVSKSLGFTIIAPPAEHPEWNETGRAYKIDVEEFLRAAAGTDNYYYHKGQPDEVQILQKTSTGVRLLQNVDFQNTFYQIFGNDNFQSVINGVDQTFDGNYNYIHNLGCTLFSSNNGHIINLGIKGAKGKFISDEQVKANRGSATFDQSRQGLIAGWNHETGDIRNIRIQGPVEIEAFVNPESENADQEAHNIGGVVGSNVGKVSAVDLSGTYILNIKGYNDIQINSSVMAGGICGQNAGNGSLSDINIQDGQTFSMNITNYCKGNGGAYYIGGVVGNNTANLTGVILSSITIDSTPSQGAVSYIGGLIGWLNTTLGFTSRVSSCIVEGTAKAGYVSPYGDIDSHSCIGGIAGMLQGPVVTDCRTSFSIAGTPTPVSDVVYATGGAFGWIRQASNVSDIMAYGNDLTGMNSAEKHAYTGNFAGITYAGNTWDSYYNTRNITVKDFGYQPIGISTSNP